MEQVITPVDGAGDGAREFSYVRRSSGKGEAIPRPRAVAGALPPGALARE